MKFRSVRRRKKPNSKRGLIFVLLLFIVIYLWFNADGFITAFLGK